MDRNYDKPYRGLPTEIRLQIWSLMIPDKAIIATKNFKEEHKRNWPSTQSQLLRLNHQIYDEVLPFFKDIEVYLHPEFSSRESWRQIGSALKSPILNKLAVSWEQRHASKVQSQWLSTFFFNSLFVDLPHPLHRITISIWDPFFCDCLYPAFVRAYLRDPEVVAVLAAAYLQRGFAIEVCLKVYQISRRMMPRWSAEHLSQCLAGTAKVDPGVELPTIDCVGFRRCIVEHIGLDLNRDVHITAEFPENNEGEYNPTSLVIFKLAGD